MPPIVNPNDSALRAFFVKLKRRILNKKVIVVMPNNSVTTDRVVDVLPSCELEFDRSSYPRSSVLLPYSDELITMFDACTETRRYVIAADIARFRSTLSKTLRISMRIGV